MAGLVNLSVRGRQSLIALKDGRRKLVRSLCVLVIALLLTTNVQAQNNIIFQYFYDDLGQLTKVVDSTGTVIEYVYDPVGNILQIKRSSVTPSTLAIFNFTPQRGTAGQTITIQGQGFGATSADNGVQFNGTSATALSASSTTLAVIVPTAATTGPISVTVAGQTATSTNNFTVIVPPAITGVSCKSALFNKFIPNLQVSGTNLNGATFSFAAGSGFPPINVTASSVNASGTSAILSLQIGAQAGTFALVATNLAGSSSSIASPINRFTIVNPTSTADTTGAGFSDVIKAEFCADPLDPNSIPNIPDGVAIQTIQDLQNISIDLAGNYHLANDIDASPTATWNGGLGFLPIGSTATPFTGTLKGNGHTITGLFINSAETDVGLFGSAGMASLIEDVNLLKVNITGTGGGQETGATGALVGHLDGQITNCTVSGSITGTSTGNFVGGLVGLSDGGIRNSSAIVTVSVPGFGTAGGGLVGLNVGSITNSSASGTVTNPGLGGGMGGLVGENEATGSIVNSQASATVTGNSNTNASIIAAVGGLVGFNSAKIRQSRATGSTTGTNASLVGGLVGANATTGVIQQSFATGSAQNGIGGSGGGLVGLNAGGVQQSLATGAAGNSSTGGNEGGLVGANELTGTITQSYATGAVSGHLSSDIGSLVGFNGDDSPQIAQSYSIGAVVGPDASCAGGLVGCNPAGNTVLFSYWDMQTSLQPVSAAGIGETTAKLQSGTLPDGFDSTVWAAKPGLYPYLIWLGPAPVVVTVTSSQNPTTLGQSVTLSATVSPVLPVPTGTPTGSVTFLDGTSPIGTGTLSGGVASFATSALAVGSHNITVSYAGDGTFDGGTGSLTGNPQLVNEANSSTAHRFTTDIPGADDTLVLIRGRLSIMDHLRWY